MFRTRAGAPVIFSVLGVSGGGLTVHFPAANITAQKVFSLSPNPLTLRAGDAFALQFERLADAAEDTCPDVAVTGIDIRYTLRP